MRPLPGDDCNRSRSTSFTDMPNVTTPRPPMTYFLADERGNETPLPQVSTSSTLPRSRSREQVKRSSAAVDSSETATTQTQQDSEDPDTSLARARRQWRKNLLKTSSAGEGQQTNTFPSQTSSAISSRDLSPAEFRHSPKLATSQPLTPMFLESPILSATPDSHMSRRNSETDLSMDEAASQAVLSSGEDGEETSRKVDDSNDSQLVMPSLSLPTRRPFTERGKTLGRLKILIAGDSG